MRTGVPAGAAGVPGAVDLVDGGAGLGAITGGRLAVVVVMGHVESPLSKRAQLHVNKHYTLK